MSELAAETSGKEEAPTRTCEAGPPPPDGPAEVDGRWSFKTKFQGKELMLPSLASDACVGDLKALLQDETAVPAKRQKLIGLVKGKIPEDETSLASLGLRGEAPYSFMLMGTPDDKLFIDPCDRDDLPEVVDDLDADFLTLSVEWHRSRKNAAQLAKFTKSTEINWRTSASS